MSLSFSPQGSYSLTIVMAGKQIIPMYCSRCINVGISHCSRIESKSTNLERRGQRRPLKERTPEVNLKGRGGIAPGKVGGKNSELRNEY